MSSCEILLIKYIFAAEAYKNGQLQEILEKAMCSWSFSVGQLYNNCTLDLLGGWKAYCIIHHSLKFVWLRPKTYTCIWLLNRNLYLATTAYYLLHVNHLRINSIIYVLLQIQVWVRKMKTNGNGLILCVRVPMYMWGTLPHMAANFDCEH